MLPPRTLTSSSESGLNCRTGLWTRTHTHCGLHSLARRVARGRRSAMEEEGRRGEISRQQKALRDGIMVGRRQVIDSARLTRTSGECVTDVANRGTSPASAGAHLSISNRERETAKAAVK